MVFDLDQAKQKAASVGFSGTAIVDIHPSIGVIRLKLSVNPRESLAEFTRNYASCLAMTLSGLNLTVKTHTAEEKPTS